MQIVINQVIDLYISNYKHQHNIDATAYYLSKLITRFLRHSPYLPNTPINLGDLLIYIAQNNNEIAKIQSQDNYSLIIHRAITIEARGRLLIELKDNQLYVEAKSGHSNRQPIREQLHQTLVTINTINTKEIPIHITTKQAWLQIQAQGYFNSSRDGHFFIATEYGFPRDYYKIINRVRCRDGNSQEVYLALDLISFINDGYQVWKNSDYFLTPNNFPVKYLKKVSSKYPHKEIKYSFPTIISKENQIIPKENISASNINQTDNIVKHYPAPENIKFAITPEIVETLELIQKEGILATPLIDGYEQCPNFAGYGYKCAWCKRYAIGYYFYDNRYYNWCCVNDCDL